MRSSLMLAQIIGFYYVIMGFLMLFRTARFRVLIRQLQTDSTALFTSAILAILIGIIIIVFHNFWVADWRVIITLIGWISLIKGILWLSIPEHMAKTTANLLAGKGLYIAAVVIILLGLWLAAEGLCSANWAGIS